MQQSLPFLVSDSPVSRRMREIDWSATPLGDPAKWPAELIGMICYMFDTRFPTALILGPSYTTIYNDAFTRILGGKGDVLGHGFADIWHEVWDYLEPMVQAAYGGQATFIENYHLPIERFGRRKEKAYFTFCYSPLRLADGTIIGMVDTVIEMSETMVARERAEVLNKELAHRLKNNLSLVQSIAMQSLKKIEQRAPVEAFERRILALGKAHDVLLRQSWDTGSVQQVADQVLSLHGDRERVRARGDDIVINAKMVLSLSLVLHELATNAAKYGALSNADGHVELSWWIERDGNERDCVLNWREHGGPPVSEPTQRGFGTRLIGRVLAGIGTVTTHFHPAGFEAIFRAPLDAVRPV